MAWVCYGYWVSKVSRQLYNWAVDFFLALCAKKKDKADEEQDDVE